jgi:hypothetical protein
MAMCANHPEAMAVAFCRDCGKPLCAVCRNESQGAIYCAAHLPFNSAVNAPPPVPGPASWDWTRYPGQPSPPSPSNFAGSSYTTGYEAPPSGVASDIPPLGGDPMGGAGSVPPYTPLSSPPSPYTASSPYTAPVGRPNVSPALALILGTIPGVGAIYNGQYAKGLIHAVVFGLLITIVSSHENSSLAPLVGILIAVWWFYMVIEAFHTARKRHDGIPVDEFSSLLNLRNKTAFPIGAVVLISLGGLLLLDTSGLIPIDRLLRFWPIGLILAGVYMLYARAERSHIAAPPATATLPQEFIDERR